MTEAEIETVARRICVELDLDPDAWIWGGVLDPLTDVEEERDYGDKQLIPMVAISMPRWRRFRRAASHAIAASRALSALTSAAKVEA